jgi:EAL domain-containing protein (putative c-di-GMP-specific phosphodiesterase class I)
VIASMLDAGRNLGVPTVAEGIERQAELDILLGLGCDLGQGYLLGPPLDMAGTAELLRSAGHPHRDPARG